ncbi:hypothetical protein QW180_31495 [Vibrio sinaloensis]|nr:hypothetical protein [Vibrio sinaloensis]
MQSDLDALSNTQSRLDSQSSTFSSNAIQGFQNYLENDAGLSNQDVKRIMTAYQPEDIAEAKDYWQGYVRTEDFAKSAGIDGDSARIVSEMNSNHQASTPSGKPTLNTGQETLLDNEWNKSQDKVSETRSDLLHSKGTGGIFNQERFDGVSHQVQQRQESAQESITPQKKPMIEMTIKPQVEEQVTPQERHEYVTSDQSYPAAPGYTKKPSK